MKKIFASATIGILALSALLAQPAGAKFEFNIKPQCHFSPEIPDESYDRKCYDDKIFLEKRLKHYKEDVEPQIKAAEAERRAKFKEMEDSEKRAKQVAETIVPPTKSPDRVGREAVAKSIIAAGLPTPSPKRIETQLAAKSSDKGSSWAATLIGITPANAAAPSPK